MHNSSKFLLLGITSAIVSVAQFSESAIAQTLFPSPKTFTITKACNATTSLSGSNPVALTVNAGYSALGENKIPGGTHAWISVPGIGSRWVALTCGTYGTVSTTLPAGTVKFFDNTNNPVSGLKFGSPADVTPVAPVLNSFDNAIVNLCSTPGTVVSTTNFKSTMNANPAVLENLRLAISPTSSAASFLDELTTIWFNVKGFDHVFCGEPVAGGAIGGLHFVGRYVELESKGLAGRLANNLSNEEVALGAVYTMGVKMLVGTGSSQSTIKGYSYTLNAEETLRLGAIAYKKNPNTTSTNTACLLPVVDDSKSFKMVFVRRSGGIRTFYPDATPSTTDPTCAI